MLAENPEEVLDWNTEKLWNAINLLENKEDYKKEISRIRFGTLIKVPIWYIINEWYEVYPSSARIKIMGYGKYKIWDFMEEKELRDSKMRKIIMENIEDDSPTEPRLP